MFLSVIFPTESRKSS